MVIQKLVLRSFKDNLNYDDAYIVLEGKKYGVIKIENHNFDESASITTEELLKQGGTFIVLPQWDEIRENICFAQGNSSAEDNSNPESTCNYYVLKNNLWGIVDESGNMIQEPFYEEVIVVNDGDENVAKCHRQDFDALTINGCVIVHKEDKWGMLGGNGLLILPLIYDSISIISYHWAASNVFTVGKGGLFGVVDKTGKFLIEMIYPSLHCEYLEYMWNCTIFRIESKTGIGYVRLGDGKCIVAPEWERVDIDRLYLDGDAEPYGHIFTVWKNGYCGLITDDEGLLISPIWDEIIPQRIKFNDPLSYNVRKGRYWGCCDAKGRLICDALWDEVGALCKGVACVKKDGNWGAIDTTGQTCVPVEWDEIEGFYIKRFISKRLSDYSVTQIYTGAWDFKTGLSRELSWVQKNHMWGIIDKAGIIIVEPIWEIHDKASAFIFGPQEMELQVQDCTDNDLYITKCDDSVISSRKVTIQESGKTYCIVIRKADSVMVSDWKMKLENAISHNAADIHEVGFDKNGTDKDNGEPDEPNMDDLIELYLEDIDFDEDDFDIDDEQ